MGSNPETDFLAELEDIASIDTYKVSKIKESSEVKSARNLLGQQWIKLSQDVFPLRTRSINTSYIYVHNLKMVVEE